MLDYLKDNSWQTDWCVNANYRDNMQMQNLWRLRRKAESSDWLISIDKHWMWCMSITWTIHDLTLRWVDLVVVRIIALRKLWRKQKHSTDNGFTINQQQLWSCKKHTKGTLVLTPTINQKPRTHWENVPEKQLEPKLKKLENCGTSRDTSTYRAPFLDIDLANIGEW